MSGHARGSDSVADHRCPGCGAPAPGRFCAQCGAPTGGGADSRAGSRAVWAAAGFVVLPLLVFIWIGRQPRAPAAPAPEVPAAAALAPFASGGTGGCGGATPVPDPHLPAG